MKKLISEYHIIEKNLLLRKVLLMFVGTFFATFGSGLIKTDFSKSALIALAVGSISAAARAALGLFIKVEANEPHLKKKNQ